MVSCGLLDLWCSIVLFTSAVLSPWVYGFTMHGSIKQHDYIFRWTINLV